MVDAFSRHAIRVSVAQICQIIGWTSIQSSPLEILTDILHEYISGLAKIASNYALLYGQCEPNINHVALAFKDMGISVSELEEYVTYVETNTVLEVPKYPIPKESHLNHLKPGSREVVTRPVHIHEHLPPMHPHLEDQDYLINKSPLTVEVSPTDSLSPLSSPKNVFKKPGDPISNEIRRGRLMIEDEVRPLREISSVMMTTSGFLSPAREGKLPEARTQPIEFSRNSLSPEGPSSLDDSIDKLEKKKKIKPIEVPKKIDKENKVKEEPCEQKESEEESKGKKLVNNKETSKLKALKTGALKVPQKPPSPSPSPLSLKKIKSQSSPTANSINSSIKQNKVKSPKNDKRPISPLIKDVVPVTVKETSLEDVKLPSEPDKHKLNIFKKISKVKEEHDDFKILTMDNRDIMHPHFLFDPQQKKVFNDVIIKEEEMETHIDVENTSPPIKYEYPEIPVIEKAPDIPKIPEPKKRKKDKLKEKKEIEFEKDPYHNSPKTKYNFEDNVLKTKLPSGSEVVAEENNSTPNFPFFPNSVPLAPSLIPTWNHPLIPHNVYIPPVPPVNLPNSTANVASVSMKNQDVSPAAGQQTTISSSSSSSANPALSATPALTTFPNKENNLIFVKKKERKRDKKLKEKIKRKKDKKDKNKIKDKSERKKLKLEKKERAKLKLKKEKKDKKKEKEGLVNRIEPGHIAEDVLNTLQSWTSDSIHNKKNKTEEKDEPANLVPKITFKLGPASPKETLEPSHRKIVIKPVIKKEEDNYDINVSVNHDTIKPLSNPPKIKTHKGGKLNHHGKNDVLEKPSTFTFAPLIPPKQELFPAIPKWEADPNKVWICPACSRPDDGSPMIACDMCDLWFHWTCVGIQEAIESDWYCNICTAKREEGPSEKKKKHRKKKS